MTEPTLWVLWIWSIKNDDWEYLTEATEDAKRRVLSKSKMRNPRTARFKWTTGYKPKRWRQREKRVPTDDEGKKQWFICPYGCGLKARQPLRGHAAVCPSNPERRKK